MLKVCDIYKLVNLKYFFIVSVCVFYSFSVNVSRLPSASHFYMTSTVPIIFVYDEALLFDLHLPAPAGRGPDKQFMIKHKLRFLKLKSCQTFVEKLFY